MFDIGWTEILVVAVVAIIVVGPKDLPGMLRSLGRYAGKIKRTAGEFRAQFDEAIQDTELDDLRSAVSEMSDLNPVNEIRDSVTDGLNPLSDIADDIKGSIEDATGAGTAEEAKGASADKTEPEAKKPVKAKKTTSAKKPAKASTDKPGSGKTKSASAKTGA